MRARFAATLPLILIACGDNALAPDEPAGGTRLALVRYVYADGTEQVDPGRFHDRDRDESCSPVTWSDGARYCTPDAGETIYVDAACQTEVGRVPAGTAPRYAIHRFSIRGQDLASKLYRLGAPAARPAQRWHLRDGICDGPFDEPAGFDYNELADAITSDALVRIRRADPIGNDRLQLVRDTSTDGMQVPVAFYDRALHLDCTPRPRANQAMTECAPRDVVVASYFHDATCTQPEIALRPDALLPDAIEVVSDATGCPADVTIGSPVDPPLYESVAGTCSASAAPSDDVIYLTGDPLALAPLARTSANVAGHRLQPLADGPLADGPLADAMLRDTELATDCARTSRGDTLRCVPATSAKVVSRFADDACTTPLDLALVPAGACDPPATFAIDASGAYHALAGPHAAMFYEISTSEICAPSPLPARTAAFEVGPALPDTMFVAATVTTSP